MIMMPELDRKSCSAYWSRAITAWADVGVQGAFLQASGQPGISISQQRRRSDSSDDDDVVSTGQAIFLIWAGTTLFQTTILPGGTPAATDAKRFKDCAGRRVVELRCVSERARWRRINRCRL